MTQVINEGGMKRKGDRLTDILHIFVLFSFALAQPLFDLLSRNAEFFVARRSPPVDIVLLILILCVLPPTLVVLVEVAAGLLGRRVRKGVHSLVVAGLVACLVLPALKQIGGVPGTALLVAAAMLGVSAAIAYMRFSPVRMFLTVLSPALLIFPGLFLFNSSVFKVVFKGVDSATVTVKADAAAPVVIVVFDELPVTSLMDEHRQIDSIRYPNFAALARDATWFRNATTVSGNTLTAVPAILSGLYPNRSRLPTTAGYPHNLFTLLSSSCEMKVFESHTMICPETICGNDRRLQALTQRMHSMLLDLSVVYLHIVLPSDLTTGLPVVTQTWKDFWGETKASTARAPDMNDVLDKARASYHDRAGLFAKFVESITVTDKPTLYFLHVMLPHVPWEYLPSGKRYTEAGMVIPGLNIEEEGWSEDDWLAIQGYQRHLLQVGFVDNLLGDLLARLKTLNLYDQSLIVITADHGVGFWPNGSRRGVSRIRPRDILGVPLFIKAPNQREGVVSDRNVRTVDILPTIADILGIDLPWPVDGRSVHTVEIICSDGASIPVIPKALHGHLDATVANNDRVEFGGWTADIKNSQIPEAILIFANGKFLYSGRTEVDRPDVVKVYGDSALQRTGFHYVLPLTWFKDIDDSGVRFFAVSRNGVASELSYLKGYPWEPKSTRLAAPQESRTDGQPCPEHTKGHSGTPYSLAVLSGQASASIERVLVEKELLVFGPALAAKYDTLERKLALFGSGAKPNGLFKVGPHHDLVGRHVSEVGVAGEVSVTVELDQATFFADVDPEAAFVPAHITGRAFLDTETVDPLNLAVAVNGMIRAVTRTFEENGSVARFSAIVPETAFRAGKNNVEVFVVSGDDGPPRLRRTQSKLNYPKGYEGGRKS